MPRKDPIKRAEYDKQYREEHREELAAYLKEYVKALKEKDPVKFRQEAKERERKWRKSPAGRNRSAERDLNYTKIAGRPRPLVCEVCGRPNKEDKRICFDHDHISGKFRGWLCTFCNVTLGKAEDNPEILRKLADYLDNFNAKHKEETENETQRQDNQIQENIPDASIAPTGGQAQEYILG